MQTQRFVADRALLGNATWRSACRRATSNVRGNVASYGVNNNSKKVFRIFWSERVEYDVMKTSVQTPSKILRNKFISLLQIEAREEQACVNESRLFFV